MKKVNGAIRVDMRLRIVLIAILIVLVGILGFIFVRKSAFDGHVPEIASNPYVDDIAPELKLKGEETVTIYNGDKYEDAGVEAEDNYDDEVAIETSGEVDTSKNGEYKITYTVKDQAGNESKVERTVKVVAKPEPVKTPTKPVTVGYTAQAGGNASKIVYLTFDDGPSAYTSKLLDVLKKYDAKATFFVTCAGSDDMIKREYNEGHTVALHTCSHNYAQIYANETAYFKDLDAVKARVKRVTGYDATLIRFPGGSSNTISATYNRGIMSRLVKEVGNRGYTYFDWNVSSGDAGSTTSSAGVYNNVVSGMGKFAGGAVVLQHDIKGFSVDAVERILQYGKEHGFTFERLTAASNTAHHGVNN